MTADTRLPNVGTSVYIRRDGRILLGKRKGSHGAGTWHPPGGYLEMNEEWSGGGQREALEETGLSVEDVRFVAATNDIFHAEGKHFITLHLAANWISREPENREPDKCEGWQWFSWDALPQPLFLPVQNFVNSGYNPFTI